MTPLQINVLRERLNTLATEHGFAGVGVAGIDLAEHQAHLDRWLEQGYHGSMAYMAEHGEMRSRPELLQEGTVRVLSFRMHYTPGDEQAEQVLTTPTKAYIARYALGRDYHKLMRKRLVKVAKALCEVAETEFQFRALVDSAPALERALAQQAKLGWIGKNTMLIHPQAGSWFLLGELFTNLPLAIDPPQTEVHCGSCSACIPACPTNAFVKPWVLDARKCISYLTIESADPIPEVLRRPMGNRVFGCDDCQLACPWNKFTPECEEPDFKPRHQLDNSDLLTLFLWDEATFLQGTEGSPIRRIGYHRWLRNIAVGLGNAPFNRDIVRALESRLQIDSEMVREHCRWAIAEQQTKR